MNHFIERMNYANDARVMGEVPKTTVTIYNPDLDIDEEIELPTKWEICDVCNGNCKHVNPSIDAGGISMSEMHDDPDFYDDYMSGSYDVTCTPCGGSGKVKVPDYDFLTEAQQEALQAQQEADAEMAAERRAEYIMGC